MKPGNVREGTFQPTNAPAKHNPNKIAVLLTAPSSVIRSDCEKASVLSKFLVKAGFPDLPKVFNAECLDMQYLQNLIVIMNYLWAYRQIKRLEFIYPVFN
jgi:hypothetical protein